ncbi:MAG: SgcJ/EcaC family oxidoreductase, partial [Verrucomicrobiaceae bacterium]
MKPTARLSTGIALAILTHTGLRAQEPAAEIAGLEKAAADFVIAYNNKDADALAALFTETGELVDLNAQDVITGREDIKAHYVERFAEDEVPSVAVEVDSVRIVAPKMAVEDGTLHFTPPGEDSPARSSTYMAVLVQNDAGQWQVASTRNLTDVTSQEGHLAELLDSLKGDWTAQRDGLRLDVAFGWDESGKFISGEMLAATSDGEPVETSIRLGWDGA